MRLWDYRANRRTSAPAVEPITIRELKQHLRIEDDGEDEYLAVLIQECTQELEDVTGLALITQTWQLTLDRWPTRGREPWWDGVRQGSIAELHGPANATDVRLPRYPLASITSCTVYDEDGTSTAVTVGSTFDVDTASLPGRLTLQVGATWPVALRANNAIEIVYVAGYGAEPDDVPAPIRRAIRQLAAFAYEHRGDGCTPADAYVGSGVDKLIRRYEVLEV
jgi:uncharacterized phiE125 gp8 family phage protein